MYGSNTIPTLHLASDTHRNYLGGVAQLGRRRALMPRSKPWACREHVAKLFHRFLCMRAFGLSANSPSEVHRLDLFLTAHSPRLTVQEIRQRYLIVVGHVIDERGSAERQAKKGT